MHQPGIEPGSVPWQGTILPLDHWCYCEINFIKAIKFDDRTTFIQHKGNMPASVKIALFNHKSKLQLKRRTSPYEELGHYIKVISLSSLLIQHKRQSL